MTTTSLAQDIIQKLKTSPRCSAKTIEDAQRLLCLTSSKDDGPVPRTSKTLPTTKRSVAHSKKSTSKTSNNATKDDGIPSIKERVLVAATVINVALRSLAGARCAQDGLKVSKHLQEVSPNKQHPPRPTEKEPRLSSCSPTNDDHLRLLAACCLAAFEFLVSRPDSSTLAHPKELYELEAGILAFTGRAIALRMIDLAIDALQISKALLFSTKAPLAGSRIPRVGSASSSSSEKTVLLGPKALTAHLLALSTVSSGCQHLRAVVEHRILVLRLAASSPGRFDIKQLSEKLRDPDSSSIVNQLLECAQSPLGREYSLKNLEILARILLNLANVYSDVSHSTTASGVDVESIFQLRVLSLVVQVEYMVLGASIEHFDSRIISPLAKYIETYTSCSSATLTTQYTNISTAIAKFQARSSSLIDLPPPTDERRRMMRNIRWQMLELSEKAALHEEALKCSVELTSTLQDEGIPEVERAALCCRAAVTALRNQESEYTREYITLQMQKAASSLSTKMSGNYSNMVRMVDAGSVLRNLAYKTIAKRISSADAWTIGLRRVCIEILSSFLVFLRRFAMILPDLVENLIPLSPRSITESTLREITRTSVDVVLSSLSAIISDGIITWQALHEVLQHCLTTSVEVENVGVELSASETLKQKGKDNLVRISDLYYSFYEISKEQDHSFYKQALDSLRRSCQTLEAATSHQQRAGALHEKLYKLGRRLSSEKFHTEAKTMLLRSIKTASNLGQLQRLTSLASTKPLSEVVAEAGSLTRVLELILELSLKPEAQVQQTSSFCYDSTLSTDELGLVLELQLALLRAAPEYRMNSQSGLALYAEMSSSLLHLYDREHYPFRHRRAIYHCLQAYMKNNNCIDQSVLESGLKFALDRVWVVQGKDCGLAEYYRSLDASLAVAAALAGQGQESVMELLGSAFVTWESIIADITTGTNPTDVVEDYADWVSQLESAVQLTAMKGSLVQQIRATTILSQAVELSKEHARVLPKTLLQLSNLNLDQDCSREASLCLAKAVKLSQGLDINDDVNVEISLAYANYFLHLRLMDKWYVPGAERHRNKANDLK